MNLQANALKVPLGHFDPHTQMIAQELLRRDYPVQWLDRYKFLTKVYGIQTAFWSTRSILNSQVATQYVSDKRQASRLLREAGISTPIEKSFNRTQRNEALVWAKDNYPVVVKPARSPGHGTGATLNVKDSHTFLQAFNKAIKTSATILVQQQFQGTEARFSVIGNSCRSVLDKIPAQVKGDGKSTIRQLTDLFNKRGRTNKIKRGGLLQFDKDTLAYLKTQGYSPDTVLKKGKIAIFDVLGGIDTGGLNNEIKDKVHPSYLKIAEEVTKTFPILGVSGLDVLAKDYTKPATRDNYIIVEVNSMPGVVGHHYPDSGPSRNVCGDIVNLLEKHLQGEAWWLSNNKVTIK